MLRKASERHILPDDKGKFRRDKMDVSPPTSHLPAPSISPTHTQQARSPTQQYHPFHPPQMPQHHPMNMYGPPSSMAYPPPHHPQPHQQHYPPPTWYDPQVYGDPDMVWANMELNAGAVMNGGMEAYIIPAG